MKALAKIISAHLPVGSWAFLGKLAMVAGLSIGGLTQTAQATSVHWLTIVSLTFDDGLTQSAARDILAKHRMQGTFYINSDLIGSGGTYLTKAELDALYADGNEIGGHTIGHANLATLSDDAQRKVICNDLQTLLDWGYPVHSFAYPYASTGPTTQSIVAAGCPGIGGYQSARMVGNLTTGTTCRSCPRAESLPPANPYYISTNNSIASTTTLDDLKGYVTQAETSGGGWVPLVFHRVCDDCSALSVTPAIFDAFLTWLEERTAEYTYVRTVHQVMTGDYPPPPPPPQLGANLLINPSLEMDANNDNKADCWSGDTYGSNTGSFAHINDPLLAHSGNFSDQITITSYSSGDRKLLPTLDSGQTVGGCAPAVVPGETYQLSAWYKASAKSTVVMFYLDANGAWRYWQDGPQLPASSTWSQMTSYLSEVPNGAKAISFGLALTSVGTLATDDYSMASVFDSPPPADTIPPAIVAFAPKHKRVVSGAVNLRATATDNVAVRHVDFLINGAVVARDKTYPYAVIWNSTSVANGAVAYSVRVVDSAGNRTVSGIQKLTVKNNLTPPAITFKEVLN